ncbi:MAG: 23S rRNA (uracil(1939)-C(5))-methyltransferase RlmD [Candidatus Kapaibacterium sp.]
MNKSNKSELVELDVIAAGFEGVCISKYNEKVVFTKYTVPGDRILASIKKNRKKFYEARVEKILVESKDRITPLCKHFGTCGGCSRQNMTYDKQLEWKSVNVKDVFERIGKIHDAEHLPIIAVENEFNYRNKMEFSFGASRWLSTEEINSGLPIRDRDFAFGLHLPGRYDRIIDIKNCSIQHDYANEIMNAVRFYSLDYKVKPYNVHDHSGFVRGLIIRYSLYSDEFMTILMTKKPESSNEEQFLEWYKNEFSRMFTGVTNVIHAINESKNPVDISSYEVISGNGFLTEDILGVKFQISPFSFFQTNSYQLNKFINAIIETCKLKSDDVVWDLYCGTGSITLPASRYVKKITGIELVESSVEDARKNARINQISNVEFFQADLHNKKIPDLLNSLEKPDIIILDPPRSGISPNLIEHLLEIAPERIVYVSCNPATQARDCNLLYEKYSVETVQPVDMFPQTYHIESIASLKRRS